MTTPKSTTVDSRQRRKSYRVNTIDTQRFNEIFSDIERRLSAREGIGQDVDMRCRKMIRVKAGTRPSDGLRRDQAFLLEDLISIILGTANQITVTDNGDETITLSIPIGAVIDFANGGLSIQDTGGDNSLVVSPGTDLTSNRTLTIATGDSDRTITLSGNPTLDDWFDQAVKAASTPTFATALLNSLTASRLVATDASKNLESVSDVTGWVSVLAPHLINTDDGDGTSTIRQNRVYNFFMG